MRFDIVIVSAIWDGSVQGDFPQTAECLYEAIRAGGSTSVLGNSAS